MSSHSLHASADEQQRLLDEALGVVKVQAYQMKRCLDGNRFMDGLKHCSTMLAELRTSALTPKNYYELYMSIFDSLRFLTTYLHDAHVSEKHHLADLYELVQYAGNIIPRLYLMITVGSVYMGMPDAPVKELMQDMMDMCRGVQHPTRGLFLRHYLSGMSRDHLPMGTAENSNIGNLYDSIDYILTNFTEMNKLWVRLQHQGHSRERERREMERKELRILVGTNLVRVSQLEGVDLELYQSKILPAILEQVVTCKDAIAQEYLMEVIIQVFHDDFHLRSLAPFLEATAKLHPKVNVRQIVIALIDRLAAYAAREAEIEAGKNADGSVVDSIADGVSEVQIADGAPASSVVKKKRGIPEDVKLFEIFWEQVVNLVKARPDIAIQDVTALLESLINLSLSCYPENLDYVDHVLEFAKERVAEAAETYTADLHSPATIKHLLSILLAPVPVYPSILVLLNLPNYRQLLDLQPFSTRRSVALAIVTSLLKAGTILDNANDVNGILDLCGPLIRDQKDSTSAGSGNVPSKMGKGYGFGSTNGEVDEEFAEEQGHVARMVHLFQNDDPDNQLLLLSTARKQFSDGGKRIKYTLPPIVFQSVALARRYKKLEGEDAEWDKKCTTLFRFIHQVISVLYTKAESSDMSFRLFLVAGQAANECGFEEIAYEFFVQAFTIYEDSISESKSQFAAITLLIGALQRAHIFSPDNYDTLITKCALHASKLLKKPDQCRAVYTCSHLFWATPEVVLALKQDNKSPTADAETSNTTKEVYRDGKRVLECLQKALKIADSCMDSVTNVELFVEILNRYIYFYEKQNQAVTVKYLNGLIDLIHTNLGNVEASDVQQPNASSSALVEHSGGSVIEYVNQHFRNTLAHLQARKTQRSVRGGDQPTYDEVEFATS